MRAKFWERKGEAIKCKLCPHECVIGDGKRGICGVRENRNGELYTLIYAMCSSAHVDPIEKKPLFHFYPGSYVYSLGTAGCNFKCLHCQNYEISQVLPEEISLYEISPEQAIERAKKYSSGIAWTYNEPTIWWEYAYDTAKLAKKEGLYTVFVTNGYINEEPLREIAKYLDAVNVDVKSMSESFYKNICKAKLEPVLNACKMYREEGVHIEITYLVIPTKNEEDVERFIKWVIEEMGDEQVVHFTAFYPDYKMLDIPPTSFKKLLQIYNLARKEGLKYVYLGNVPPGDYENTYCPQCGNKIVERRGFSARVVGLDGNRCGKCGYKINIRV